MATIISQELFDETLLENEECFDLSPNEALRETMDQFCRQLGHPPCSLRRNNDDDDVNSNDNDSKVTLPQSIPPSMAHLTLTHPSTPAGQVERTNRTNFCHWLTLLDECVGVDGVVTLPSPPPSSATVATVATASSSSSSLSLVEQGDDNPNVLLEALSHLSIKLQSKNDNNNNNNDGDEEEGGALPYLILFQQSSSIYTLLSFLTTIIPPNDNHDSTSNGNSGNNEGQSIHQPFKLHLLQQTIHTLSSILTSSLKENNVKCTQLRGELRDLFIVGLNRLVSLLWRFVVIVTLENGSVDNDGGENGVEGVTEEEAALENDGADNATTITTTTTSRKKLQTTVLLDLLKLSISAVRGCEGGKVAFVQSTLDEATTTAATTTTTRMWNTKRGGVQVIFTILSNTLLNNTTTTTSTNDSSNDDKESTTITNMEIIEATCQLLTTLCRYDDFRTPTSGGGATAAAAAAAGGVSTSSAHDHAMEFHRVGVERLLIKIANGVLNDLLVVYGEGGEEDADDGNEKEEEGVLAKKELLAAAVLTALRVLAVNDEIIQTMVALGVLPIVTKALKLSVTATTDTNDEEGSNTRSSSNLFLRKHRLAAGALGLIRNLCGNDEIKTNLCLGSSSNNSTDQQSSSSSSLSISSTPSALPHLLHAMQLYPTISPIQEHACGTLAAMALRRPSNARAIIEEGGPRLIIAAMKRHTENVSVQRQGALAVRNIVSRLLRDLDGGSGGSGDNATASGNTTVEVEDARSAIRDRFGELGVEEVLRNIAGRHQGSVDEAYAALRDLGYSVTLTKFSAEDLQEGNASSNAIGRTMMFGEKHNSNFRPVYEQSAGLSNAVDEAVSNFGA